jgi:3-oxoacyl-[acyl-carrier protein] reductase
MPDRYQALANSPVGKAVSRRLGLPIPPPLRRHRPGMPVVTGPVLLGGARGGRLREPAAGVLRSIGAHVVEDGPPPSGDGQPGPAALVYDASGIDSSERLRSVYEFFSPVVRELGTGGRAIVLSSPPQGSGSTPAAVAQRALEGFVRSLGKETGARGSTAQLVEVAAGGDGGMESTLRFLLSPRSAYVSGQVVRIGAVDGGFDQPEDWDSPLAGRVAAVTGAARGIGESIAATLARDGAEVICIDVPGQGGALSEVANRIGGTALQLDITDARAPERLAGHVTERHGRLEVLVHNAGITRDKTLARMRPEQWDSVIDVNLSSQERLTGELFERDLLGAGARIVCVSSVSGIAGNRGQTNYATSKAGVIGLVEALAEPLSERGATINAVAPGFIETGMTAAMPLATREAGRRTNSLAQGGRPVDVAETIAWLASPASAAVNGNVVRVCGQALLGA